LGKHHEKDAYVPTLVVYRLIFTAYFRGGE